MQTAMQQITESLKMIIGMQLLKNTLDDAELHKF